MCSPKEAGLGKNVNVNYVASGTVAATDQSGASRTAGEHVRRRGKGRVIAAW